MKRSRRNSRPARTLAAVLALAFAPACNGAPEPQSGLAIGVLLSYTGPLTANSINSDRALRMAIEAANTAGGVGGQPLRLLARDTGSDPSKVLQRAQELTNAGVALVIGPDTDDLVIGARAALQDRTIILPSFATSSDVLYKTPSWFVIGAPIGRMACELAAQLHADMRKHPVVIFNPSGYSASIAWTLTNTYGMPKYVLPANEIPSSATLSPIAKANADAYVLAAFPASAVSLFDALLAKGQLTDPSQWYLAPTLHSPVFLDLIPKGGLAGASGVAQGASPEGTAFRARFTERWQDEALDDAYPFYDAGALAALSLQRALVRGGEIPTGTALSPHLQAVTKKGGIEVHWFELGRGLELLRQGQEITYMGLSGQLEFDALGQTPGATTTWWTIDGSAFAARSGTSDCR
jgi:branched-chain amino acid transport system substrate-binding protein